MRTMTITMQVNDEEAENLLRRIGERGDVEISGGTPLISTSAAPAAPAAPTTPAESAEVDINGVPWDARYHAKTKTKKKDGTWKAASGMDDATKAEAEKYAASFKSASETPETPAAPAAPETPTAPAAPTAPAPVSFEQLTAGFTEVIARIGQDALMAKLGEIYEACGVPADGSSLQTNETQRTQVLQMINQL